MKKIFTLFAAVLMAATVMAEESSPKARFTYEAGAEVVSSYIWRGLYNGGLSLQPSVSVGFVSLADKVQFDVNVWGNVGASDWVFRKGRPNPDEEGNNPNTYFVPEVDSQLPCVCMVLCSDLLIITISTNNLSSPNWKTMVVARPK